MNMSNYRSILSLFTFIFTLLLLSPIQANGQPNDMERLLANESESLRTLANDMIQKYNNLINLYPEIKAKREIVLEESPGTWQNNKYVSFKRVFGVLNGESRDTTLLLDTVTRDVYHADRWTRTIIRLHYPNVENIELETKRENFNRIETLERATPEIKLKTLRLMSSHLRNAIYYVDMLTASYERGYHKQHEQQIDFER